MRFIESNSYHPSPIDSRRGQLVANLNGDITPTIQDSGPFLGKRKPSKVAQASCIVSVAAALLQGCGTPADLDKFDYYTYTGVYDPTPQNHSSGDEFRHTSQVKLPEGTDPNQYICSDEATKARLVTFIKSMPIYTHDKGTLIPETCTISRNYE